MFCPNCHIERHEDREYCSRCGVKLENRLNKLNKKKDIQCPYCGHYTTKPKCKNCNHWIDKLNHPSIASGIVGFVHTVPGKLKEYKWDDTFVKTNLVIIVAIMGIVIIIMLFMNL
jgi:DNA-directed RNA polymerase subunit RPC12/RpoP